MARWLLLVSALALAASTAACTQGNECDTCSQDSDCDAGLFCENFRDDDGQLVGKRCASGLAVTTCRVR